MKLRLVFFLIAIPLLFGGCKKLLINPAKRIACIGTSITDGYVLPVEQTYPYQLQLLTNSPDKVLNYGVGGCTVLKKGDRPYWQAEKYQFALQWKPTTVIIEFGTNDSKKQNWQYKDEFKSDYLALINSFRKLSSSPKIYICIPTPAFRENFEIQPDVVKNEIVPLVYEIARENNLPIIDFNKLMLDHSELFPDGIHPNAEGAALLAKEVHKVISAN
ncbi:sialate O-acetylesterase [Spirosoma taeanense]|uniref:Sialate O-acetylesterase n=1 Tax=Spirosoma taeanense TaxID=2735870 RepID=A0A6M5YD20_9BACT|nr:GDSL-type esterase/lipase family protein [Spirosoma taeanense]QJW91210.1 sialate O-acetylesterase [Spirosoma taeanense]